LSLEELNTPHLLSTYGSLALDESKTLRARRELVPRESMKPSEKLTSEEHWVINLDCPVAESAAWYPQCSGSSRKQKIVLIASILALAMTIAGALAWLGV
jgi:hypothetical protein